MTKYIYRSLFLGCLLVIAFAFGMTAVLAYASGRWQIVPGPEILCSKICGVIVGIIGAGQVLKMVKQHAIFTQSACYGFVIGVLVIIFRGSSKLLIYAYIVGFEHAVFSAATVEQWGTLATIAEYWLAQPSHHADLISALCPDFVRKVYPNRNPYPGIIPTTMSNIDDVLIFWRGVEFNGGVVIGKGHLQVGDPPGLICKKQYSNSVTIIIFRAD